MSESRGEFHAVAESVSAWTAPLAEELRTSRAIPPPRGGCTIRGRTWGAGDDVAGRVVARSARAVRPRVGLERRRRAEETKTTTRRTPSETQTDDPRLGASRRPGRLRRRLCRGAGVGDVVDRDASDGRAVGLRGGGDCEYYGASELGGCARRRPRGGVLRHYVAAARHARAALAAGYADDAADARRAGKYSRRGCAEGEGCERDDARARAALIRRPPWDRGDPSWPSRRPRRAPRGGRRERRRARARGRSHAQPRPLAECPPLDRFRARPSASVSSMSTSTWNALDALGDYVDARGGPRAPFSSRWRGPRTRARSRRRRTRRRRRLLGFVLGWTFFVQPAMRQWRVRQRVRCSAKEGWCARGPSRRGGDARGSPTNASGDAEEPRAGAAGGDGDVRLRENGETQPHRRRGERRTGRAAFNRARRGAAARGGEGVGGG